MKQYYYFDDKSAAWNGPLPLDELSRLYEQELISQATLVCDSQSGQRMTFIELAKISPPAGVVTVPVPFSPELFQQLPPITQQPKNRNLYILLALFFGGIGLHNIYAKRIIPTVILYAAMALTMLSGMTMLCFGYLMALSIWIGIECVVVTRDGNGIEMEERPIFTSKF